jgi:hypothetical protein
MCCSNRTREGWVLGLVFLGVIVSFGKKRDSLTINCCFIRTREGWVLGLVFLGVIVSFGKKRVSLTRICCSNRKREDWDSLGKKREGLPCCSSWTREVHVLALVYLGFVLSIGKICGRLC